VRRNAGPVGRHWGRPQYVPGCRFTPDARAKRLEELIGRSRDLGDVKVSGDVEADQQRLGETLAPYIERGNFVIVLGGGHETSCGHFLGYALAGRKVEIRNWDAHADVRELASGRAHSGSPFRQALEDWSRACGRQQPVDRGGLSGGTLAGGVFGRRCGAESDGGPGRQTARLAAVTVWWLLRGRWERR